MKSTDIVKNDLFDYQNRFIYQLNSGFKFSLDSILLAEFANVDKAKSILDMCTGNAPVPLILSKKTKEKITCFEIQKDIFELADRSIKLNNLDEQIEVINDDIKNINKYFKAESFDVITCNPPYFKVSEDSYINDSNYLKIARHEIAITLEDVFEIAFKYLSNNGCLYLIHRANRLDDIIYLGRLNKMSVKEVQLIKTKEKEDPNTVIVKCVKNGKSGIKVKDTICIENLKTYQNLFEKR